MPFVRFLELNGNGEQQEAGRIAWDGSRLSVHPDNPLMRNVMALPIVAPSQNGPRRLTAKDGEAFLHGLQFQYKSAYLMATAPEEDAKLSIAEPGGKDKDPDPDMELWEAILDVLPAERPDKLPHECGFVEGIKVILVDGDAVKLDHDMDMVEGANDLELKERDGESYIPDSEVWIDALLDSRCWPFVCYHECQERADIKAGLTYDRAHERANAAERKLRLAAKEEGEE